MSDVIQCVTKLNLMMRKLRISFLIITKTCFIDTFYQNLQLGSKKGNNIRAGAKIGLNKKQD